VDGVARRLRPGRQRDDVAAELHRRAELDRRADLDADTPVQEEVRNAARTLMQAIKAKLDGKLVTAGEDLRQPRQK
jgi:hypothetical protein